MSCCGCEVVANIVKTINFIVSWIMKNISKLVAGMLAITLCVAFASFSYADLDQRIGKLQADVDSIEQDISSLEKNLLFPPLTRVEVYLSLDRSVDFIIRTVSISIDGQEKSFHIYSDSDLAALRLGGLQHFWEGNVALGGHEITARFKAVDRKGKSLKGKASLNFEKTLTGHSFELKVSRSEDGKVPVFSIKDWGDK